MSGHLLPKCSHIDQRTRQCLSATAILQLCLDKQREFRTDNVVIQVDAIPNILTRFPFLGNRTTMTIVLRILILNLKWKPVLPKVQCILTSSIIVGHLFSTHSEGRMSPTITQQNFLGHPVFSWRSSQKLTNSFHHFTFQMQDIILWPCLCSYTHIAHHTYHHPTIVNKIPYTKFLPYPSPRKKERKKNMTDANQITYCTLG